MDNLITHLEKTLNEDECVQEALLLLKNLEKIPSRSTSIDDGSQNRTLSNQSLECLESETTLDECKETVNPELVALYGLTSFLKNDFELPNELPLRIVAHRLNISFKELRELCRSNNETIMWSSSFFPLCQQIIDCFENKPVSAATGDDKSKELKIKKLRCEIETLKIKTQRGTVTDFVRKNIGQYLEKCAAPMALGDANFGHYLVTQELLLNNTHIESSDKGAAHETHHGDGAVMGSTQQQTVSDVLMRDLFPTSPSLVSPPHSLTASSSIPSSSLFKLAPLVEFPRCPKHFIVPLMEPDLLGDFRGAFVPSISSLGVDARRLHMPVDSAHSVRNGDLDLQSSSMCGGGRGRGESSELERRV